METIKNYTKPVEKKNLKQCKKIFDLYKTAVSRNDGRYRIGP